MLFFNLVERCSLVALRRFVVFLQIFDDASVPPVRPPIPEADDLTEDLSGIPRKAFRKVEKVFVGEQILSLPSYPVPSSNVHPSHRYSVPRW